MELAYEEIFYKFDISILENPDLMISKYRTNQSPLLRSSTLETFAKIIVMKSDIELKSDGWLIKFEKMRQLLDDLLDIREDIKNGRITYPVLLALANKSFGKKLKQMIMIEWNSSISYKQVLNDENWYRIKNIIIQAGAFDTSLSLAKKWIDEVYNDIKKEAFCGDTTALFILLELKRAFADRIMRKNFDNYVPAFNVFNSSL